MIGRKSILGLALLCAPLFSAFAATNASAEQKAYTCTTTAGVKDYNDEHCVTNVGAGKGTRGHTVIAENNNTEVTVTNAKTSADTTAAEATKLRGTLGGVITEVVCTEADGVGTLNNAAASVTITKLSITYSQCTITEPANKKCVVPGGSISTSQLTLTTAGQAASKLSVSPGANPYAEIKIEKCEEEKPPTGVYKVTGTYVASQSGATFTTTHAGVTAQNTLKWGGVKVGLETALTLSMKEGEPITLT